jgi:hypothetical protein
MAGRMEVLCPISLGEALDKLSILRIKLARIADAAKLANVRHELERLTAAIGDLQPYQSYLNDFERVNGELWEIEDNIRRKELAQEFDAQFIALARSVYRTNDKRFAIKNAVNRQFASSIVEEKSYEKYEKYEQPERST